MSTFRKILAAAFFMMLGGILSACAIGLHVVRADTGFLTVRKTRPTLKDAYVDIRRWTPQDWREHPHLAQALIESGHKDLLPRQPPAAPLPRWIPFGRSSQKDAGKEPRRVH